MPSYVTISYPFLYPNVNTKGQVFHFVPTRSERETQNYKYSALAPTKRKHKKIIKRENSITDKYFISFTKNKKKFNNGQILLFIPTKEKEKEELKEVKEKEKLKEKIQ